MEQSRIVRSTVFPEIEIAVKRISFKERLSFLESSFAITQQIKILASQNTPDMESTVRIGRLELDLAREVLALTWQKLRREDQWQTVDQNHITWLLNEAPAELCCEIVAICGNQITLSEDQRKKFGPPSTI